MDLGRWSFRHLGNFLGDALDGNLVAPVPTGGASARSSKTPEEPFEIVSDNDELDRELLMIRPGAQTDKVLAAFVPYFEGGLSIKVEGSKTYLTSIFLFGQTFTPPDRASSLVDFGLRGVETTRVYRASIEPLLKELGLGGFTRLEGASAFAFRASNDVIFILFDNRPHPWQVFAIENAYLSARDTFGRIGAATASVASTARGFFK